MATQAWLEASLRRSAALGLEVLERASRRSVDWSSTAASQSRSSTEPDTPSPIQRKHTEADSVFTTLADLMVQTTHQCKRFYDSDCCSEPSNAEKNHVHRFHLRPAPRTSTSPTLSSRRHAGTPSSRTHAGTPSSRTHAETLYSRTHAETPSSRRHAETPSSRRHAETPSSKAAARTAPGEDFLIEVTPGTYAVTASMPEAQQQTQLVSIKAGESINLTFHL